MVGKLTRRDFLCQFGLYYAGLTALSERDVKKMNTYAKHLPLSRIVFESFACLEQVKQMDNKIERSPKAGESSETMQA
ncbi:MAG: hypothetical protein JST89_04930 [Cyanobacteria bacterium SZAS-4]|nr:hypothetical protein [Cyanobacteria bacterium SZAS-4]